MITIGARANEIKSMGVDEEKLRKRIDGYGDCEKGSIGYRLLVFLKTLEEKKSNFLSLAVEEEIAFLDLYFEERRTEILADILPTSKL